MKFTLGQELALRTVWAVVADPEQKYLVIKGPAGTGKSEVIRAIAEDMITKSAAIHKLTGQSPLELVVTATTNKAVDALNSKKIAHINAVTIFSALGLRPYNGKLVASRKEKLHKKLVIIDESSYIDEQLANHIERFTDDTCKVIFVGDPYQLAPVGYTHAPIFDMGIEEVELTEIMRQDKNNPIQALSLALREFVKGGELPKLEVDGKHLFHIKDEDKFVDTLIEAFKKGRKAKFIGFTNQLVTNANNIVKADLENTDAIQVGDTLICNNYVSVKPHPIKTDSEVTVHAITAAMNYGVQGNRIKLTTGVSVFAPLDYQVFKDENLLSNSTIKKEMSTWADLRSGYACTIHKSQGSTYQDVFINLDELNQLNDADLSRLLYVAVSRASERVYFMGNL